MRARGPIAIAAAVAALGAAFLFTRARGGDDASRGAGSSPEVGGQRGVIGHPGREPAEGAVAPGARAVAADGRRGAPSSAQPVSLPAKHSEGAEPASGPALRVASQLAAPEEARAAPSPEGSRPPAFPVDNRGIKDAVGSVVPEIRDCYERWLEVSPGIAGKMIVKFEIAADEQDPQRGRITEARLAESGLEHAFVEGCVLNALGGLSFERPPGGEPVSVTYPFQFATADAGVADGG